MPHRMKIRAALLAAGAALIAGCAGHGEYTGNFKEEAELRLANLKAATEWDRARAQFLAGDLEKALQTVDRAMTYNDRAANAHILRGRILLEMGRLEAALASLELAGELEPDRAEAHYFRAIVYERINKPDRAFNCFIAADRADPTNGQYLLAAGEMLIEMKRLDEAWALLDDRRDDFEHNPGIRQTLGHLAMMQDRVDEAIRHFQEAHLLAPDDPALLEDLARAQAAAGMYAEAEYNLRQVLANPTMTERRDLRHLQVECLLQLDRPVEARGILDELVRSENGANDVAAWVELGNIACILDDAHRLREAGQRLVAAAPHRHEGYLFMAMWARSQGRLDSALDYATRAVEHGDALAAPLAFQGLVELELGRLEQSLRSLQAALALDPADETIRNLAAYVSETHGRS